MDSAANRDEQVLAALSARASGPGWPRSSLGERIHAELSRAILRGQVVAGTRLPSEAVLAAHFRVSRPVLRAALERLRADGLVVSVRGSGSYVQPVRAAAAAQEVAPGADLGHILHGVELRLVLEPEAAALAALRRSAADLERLQETLAAFGRATAAGEPTHAHDYGFHEAIARATANPRLLQVMQALEYDVDRAVQVWRRLGRMKPSMRLHDAVDEHQAILQCIRERDAEGARRAMRSHVEKARLRMLEQG